MQRARGVVPAILTVAACLLCSRVSGASSGFVAAPKDGASCPAVCSSVDQNPAGLQQFNAAAPIESYSCAANVSGQGLVPGYQLTSNTTCTVAWGRNVDMYNDFSCLCVEPTASLGIVNAESGSCSWACNQTVDGLVGSAAQAEASTPSDACIPAEDIGQLNRFGHTGSLGGETEGCFAAIDGLPYTTASFSCLCLFQSPAALQQGPAAAANVVSNVVATGG